MVDKADYLKSFVDLRDQIQVARIDVEFKHREFTVALHYLHYLEEREQILLDILDMAGV